MAAAGRGRFRPGRECCSIGGIAARSEKAGQSWGMVIDAVTVIGIAFGLAMDAFAVAVAASTTLQRVTGRQFFRFSWHFGLFQFLMPVLGWLLGRWASPLLESAAHWIAFGILAVLGARMILESRRADGPQAGKGDPTRGWSLVLLSLATSVDAFAVGLGLAMLGTRILLASAVIGLVAAVMTLVGMRFGIALGHRAGPRAELLGGAILVLLGIRVLIEGL